MFLDGNGEELPESTIRPLFSSTHSSSVCCWHFSHVTHTQWPDIAEAERHRHHRVSFMVRVEQGNRMKEILKAGKPHTPCSKSYVKAVSQGSQTLDRHGGAGHLSKMK